MNERTLKPGPSGPQAVVRALAAAVLACALAAAVPAAAAAATPSPPSPSEYTTSALCSPPTPGYSACLGLPACNEANGCFRKVNQRGERSPLPRSGGPEERGWALEAATDVEIAHGICPTCRILLVEAVSNANSSLYAAELTAASLGADE